MTPDQADSTEWLNLDTEVISFGGWSIHIRSGIARRDDAEVLLRPQERALVREFVNNPGLPLSYQALYFATRKQKHGQHSVTIRGAVKRLRRKLAIHPRGGCLQVIWNYGYRYLPQEGTA